MSKSYWYTPKYKLIINRETYRGIGRPRKFDYKLLRIPLEYYTPPKMTKTWTNPKTGELKYTISIPVRMPKTLFVSRGKAL